MTGLFSNDSEVKTIKLNSIEKGRLRAGIQLGNPVSGLTLGYHINNRIEPNILIGSLLDFNSLALGANVMITLYHLEADKEIFPLNAGPVIYVNIKNDNADFSLGGLVQIEYDFEIPLNLFFHTGILINLAEDESFFTWPFAFGIRYIF